MAVKEIKRKHQITTSQRVFCAEPKVKEIKRKHQITTIALPVCQS